MSATEFSHPPPVSGPYRPIDNDPRGIAGLQNLIPIANGYEYITGMENFNDGCSDPTGGMALYLPIENYFHYHPPVMASIQPMITYAHYQPVSLVQNSLMEHSNGKMAMAIIQHDPEPSTGSDWRGSCSVIISTADTTNCAFIQASGSSDTWSNCSGRTNATDSNVYHCQNKTNGHVQMRRYSDPPRLSAYRYFQKNTHGQNEQSDPNSVNELQNGLTVVSDCPVAETNHAQLAGVDSVDSVDSGLTPDHSSPEHGGSTPTTTYSGTGQLCDNQQSPTVPMINSQSQSLHSESSVGTGPTIVENQLAGSPSDGQMANDGGSPVPPAISIRDSDFTSHCVYVHVNLGEMLMVRVGNEIQNIPGPATVRMVYSHAVNPPAPLPLHVPHGHVVHQIVDENGTLQHLILSPQISQPDTAPFPCVTMPNGPMDTRAQSTHLPINSTTTTLEQNHPPSSTSCPVLISNGSMGEVTVMGRAVYCDCSCTVGPMLNDGQQSIPTPVDQHNWTTPSNGTIGHLHRLYASQTHTNEGENGEKDHSYTAGESGYLTRTMNTISGKNSIGSDSIGQTSITNGRKSWCNVCKPASNVTPFRDISVDDNTSVTPSVVKEEEDEVGKITKMLSRILPPGVCDIGSREASVQWQPLDCTETSASGGPFPQIYSSEFTYQILLYERKPDGKPTSIYRCQAEHRQQCLDNLKPFTDYFVRLKALLEERGLHGEPSSAVTFRTKSTVPDTMNPPRVQQRSKTWIMLRWHAPCDNGAKISNYHVEVEDGGAGAEATFIELYAGITKQFKLQKLQPSTLYRVRIAATNAHGKGEFSDVVLVQTAGAAPAPPDPPTLVQATWHSLALAWTRRDGDDEFQLLMEDPQTGHGYLPVATTRDICYVVHSLMRHKGYRFRLTASNDEGRSLPSEVITLKTSPSRPEAPTRPHTKGKVASKHVKIAWEAPMDTGGTDITQYFVEMRDDREREPEGGWAMVYEGPANEYQVNGLEPGKTYRFRAACEGPGGKSSYSDELLVTTSTTVPGPCRPPVLHGKPKPTSVHLKWTVPDYLGGAEISEYELVMESESASVRLGMEGTDVASTQLSIPNNAVYQGPRTDFVVSAGLLPGRSYAFLVRANNCAGAGAWSDRMQCRTAPAQPDCPWKLRVINQTSTSLRLTWDPPLSDNGAPVVEYMLHMAKKRSTRNTHFPYEEDASLMDYSDERAHRLSMPSMASTSYDTYSSILANTSPARRPSVASPTPAMDHHVEMEYSAMDHLWTGSEMAHEVAELRPAVGYAFWIQAVNSAGVSRLSDPLLCWTLADVPDAPTDFRAEAFSMTQISLTWESPIDNGSPILGYHLDVTPTMDSSELPFSLLPDFSHHTVENLLPESVYRFRLQAYNKLGVGPYSPLVTATTFSPPPPPPSSLELAATAHNSLKLRWNEPDAVSAQPVCTITYTLEIENKSGTFSPVATDLTTRSCKVPRLNASTLYRFRIRACSSTGGPGPWSEIVAFQTSRTPPPPPKSAPRVSNVTGTSCQIDWQQVKTNALGFTLSPGESFQYGLQMQGPSLGGISRADDFHTVYRGSSCSFHINGLSQGSNYRVRVFFIRVSPSDTDIFKETEIHGPPSATCNFSTLAPDGQHKSSSGVNDGHTGSSSTARRYLSDQQWALLILVMFSLVALFAAFMLERFIPPENPDESVAGTTTTSDSGTGSNAVMRMDHV